jgi:hypothetical protein
MLNKTSQVDHRYLLVVARQNVVSLVCPFIIIILSEKLSMNAFLIFVFSILVCFVLFSVTGRYFFWIFISILVLVLRSLATGYQLVRIFLSLALFFLLQIWGMVLHIYDRITCPRLTRVLITKLQSCTSYDEWKSVALKLDEHLGKQDW